MFRQSFNPFARLDVPLPLPKKEVSPRHRRQKSLARRLEEQDRELQQLSMEELPLELQHQQKNDGDSYRHEVDQDDAENTCSNSCPATLSASGPPPPGDEEDDLLDSFDSPMTHPPKTVIVRVGDLHDIPTPRKRNCMHRKRLFSLDFSTICTERGETSEVEGSCEGEDLSVEEELADASVGDDADDSDDDDDDAADDDDEWDETATFSTYPPTSIMLVPDNHLDIIATPRRSRVHRSYSDLSSTCSSHGQRSSSIPQSPFPTLPDLKEVPTWAHDEYEALYKPTSDETDEDDEIPHVMSCPDFCGDSEDEDDFSYLLDKTAILMRSIDTASCPGIQFTEGSISSID